MIGAPSGIGRYGNASERREGSTNPHAVHVDVPREEMLRTVRAALERMDRGADIRELNLRGCGLDDALTAVVAEELAEPGNPDGQLVTKIDLRGNAIGDGGCEAVARLPAAISGLTEILLSRNAIGDVGAAALATGLTGNETLKTLNLNDNQIGDAGAAALGEMLAANSGLERLLLEGNEITDEGVVVLTAVLMPDESGACQVDAMGLGAPMAANITLTQLPLGRNAKILDAEAAMLCSALAMNMRSMDT